MKTVEQQKKREIRDVTIDPLLNKQQDEVMFPEKLEKANEMLKTAKLPPNKNK